jgi:large subunit ribosomal protein L19e
MNLQKKIAAKILKCGENRVWIDSTNAKVRTAITRNDVRRFIKEGIIKKLPEKKKAKLKGKRQQRRGSIKGSMGARESKKTKWLKVVRPQRKLLKELKSKNKLSLHSYRITYKLVKGNFFRSKAHLMAYLKDKKLLIEDKK